ncbi:MAG: hypothetical protein PWQ89_999 [Verrucomicrobiota bacterium]|jgi:four helix bundle protein|nr:hypothetical protein [Verrucomicrobiota bacterium]
MRFRVCPREADETILWLEILEKDRNLNTETIEALKKEADELIAIFVTLSKNNNG